MNIDELKALAQAATPGPWGTDSEYEQSYPGHYVWARPNGLIICASQDGTDCPLREVDAAFIAAANPTVVLDLLGRLAEAEQLRSQVFTALRALNNEYNEAKKRPESWDGPCFARAMQIVCEHVGVALDPEAWEPRCDPTSRDAGNDTELPRALVSMARRMNDAGHLTAWLDDETGGSFAFVSLARDTVDKARAALEREGLLCDEILGRLR